MSTFYTVITYRVARDADALARYAELAGPAITAGGGEVIARGLPLATYEAELNERTVVVRWASLEAAKGIYETPAYRAALDALGDAAERDIRILQGVD